jgi:hypothetical protein
MQLAFHKYVTVLRIPGGPTLNINKLENRVLKILLLLNIEVKFNRRCKLILSKGYCVIPSSGETCPTPGITAKRYIPA